MAVLAFMINERGRTCLGNVLLLLNMTLAIMGLALFFYGTYFAIQVNQEKDLIKEYDYTKMTKMMMGLGTALFLFHLLGAKICFDCGHYKTRHRFQSVLICYIGLLFLALFAIMALGIMCYTSIGHFTKGFEKGMMQLMRNYSDNVDKRHELDWLQIRYRCCGSKSHKDWIAINWYSADYVRPGKKNFFLRYIKMEEAAKTKKLDKKAKKELEELNPRGVPFTCCDPHRLGPCVHDNILSDKPGYSYHKEHTLYKKGCVEAISANLKWLLRTLAFWCTAPFWIELLTIALTKYLYTSINNAIENNNPKGLGYGWLCDTSPCALCAICETDIVPIKQRAMVESDSDTDSE